MEWLFLLIVLISIISSFVSWVREQMKGKENLDERLAEELRRSREARGQQTQPRPPVGPPPPVTRPSSSGRPTAPPPTAQIPETLRRPAPAPPVRPSRPPVQPAPPPVRPVPARPASQPQRVPSEAGRMREPSTTTVQTGPDPYRQQKHRSTARPAGAALREAGRHQREAEQTSRQKYGERHGAAPSRPAVLAGRPSIEEAASVKVSEEEVYARPGTKRRRTRPGIQFKGDDLRRLVIDNEIMMRPSYPRLRACQSMWTPPPPRPRRPPKPQPAK